MTKKRYGVSKCVQKKSSVPFFLYMKTLFISIIFLVSPMIQGVQLKVSQRFDNENLINPRQMIVYKNEIFISEKSNHMVLIFSEQGELKARLGGQGEGPGEFKWSMSISIVNDKLYVLDLFGYKLHVFDIPTRNYLNSIRYSEFACIQAVVNNDETFYRINQPHSDKEFMITKYNKDGKALFSFLPGINFKGKSNKSLAAVINNGRMALSKDKIYVTYEILDTIVELSLDGKIIKRYKLPLASLIDSVKFKPYGNEGGFRLERQLNYDIKFIDDIPLVLSRDENGDSIIFALQKDGKFLEKYRMKEALTGFDISGKKLFALDESGDETYLVVYQL